MDAAAGEEPVPVTVTYLRMDAPPRRPAPPPPAIPHALMRAESPPVHFYRYLYNTVGRPWIWTKRRYWSDAELELVIHEPHVEIYVLYVRGAPAGYAELDFRGLPEAANLAYFGLMPDFIGMKLGPWFLHWAIDALWSRNPASVTVDTCTADHPAALAMYQRIGFVPWRREAELLRPMPEGTP